MFWHPRTRFVSILSFSLVALCVIGQARAYVVQIDNFQVFRNGSSYMNDTFDTPGPLDQAGTFPSGSQANYGLQNGGAQSEPGNGRRVLDTSLAPIGPSAVNPNNLIRQSGATLLTNTLPLSQSTSGLKKDDLIMVIGIFDLFVPPLDSHYEIRLRDVGGGNAAPNDELRLRVRTTVSGISRVELSHRDPTANVNTLLGAIGLDAGHDQIMLMLQNSVADKTTFTGSFAYIDAGVVGSTYTIAASKTLFNGEDWTRAGFRALETVPEPSTLAVLGIGLAGLAVARRRRNRRR